ncbi:MAG: transporter, partial [Halobacteriaceae archaeon]
MAVGTAVSTLVHFAFAAFWTGSVLFVAVGVLPAAEGSYALDRVLARLAWVSRASAAVLLLTGGHLLVAGAGVQWGTQRGWLVAAMVGLWFALA